MTLPRTQAGRDMVAWQAGIGGWDRAYWEKRVREVEDQAFAQAEAASPSALDVDPSTALAHWLCHGPEDKHTGDSMPCLPHYRMAHDFAARLAQQDGTGSHEHLWVSDDGKPPVYCDLCQVLRDEVPLDRERLRRAFVKYGIELQVTADEARDMVEALAQYYDEGG